MKQPSSNTSNRHRSFFILQVVIVVLSITIGFFGHAYLMQYRGELGLLKQSQDLLLKNTIHEVPKDPALEYGMIQGMLGALGDPYTFFVEPATHEVETDQLNGTFGGVGVRLERDSDMNWRLYPLPDSPALAAGISDGDILLAVDELPVSAETEDTTLIAAIRGPEGEKVHLTILRGSEEITFTIKRQAVPLPSVTWNILPESPQIGIVQVNRIADTSADEIQQGIISLTAQGAKAFILDLRNNGGGLVEAAIEVARLFLEDGEVLGQQFKDQDEEIFKVDDPGAFTDVPMVILINGNTASSAEIVAGALKAQQRAPLIGAPTFGKTTIQYIFDLQDGSSIHVTSGRWWVPGVSFPLQPDYLVTEDPNGIQTLQKAIEVLTPYLN